MVPIDLKASFMRKNDPGAALSVTGQKPQPKEINCFSCHHFNITYDRNFPYGCRAAGFRSRLMPSREMYVNSRLECLLFKKKREKDDALNVQRKELNGIRPCLLPAGLWKVINWARGTI
jgi:hypothetical protein